MLLNIVLIQLEILERSWTPSEYPEIYPFKSWHLLLAIKLPCISAGHTRSCCTAKDRQPDTEPHAGCEKSMCQFYFYFVWKTTSTTPKLLSLKCPAVTSDPFIRPGLLILSPSTGKEMDCEGHPALSNLQQQQCLEVSSPQLNWTEPVKHKGKLKSRHRH